MKYMVIGLGEFGRALAEELTQNFNDVIGVDIDNNVVNALKDKISVVYSMDASDSAALSQLPIDELDGVVVAIGGSFDISLRTVAALKECGVTNICARGIDDIHISILKAMSISKILTPERDAAKVYAKTNTLF